MAYKVDIIVPVYNEEQNFRSFYDFLVRNLKSDWRLLVVYDFPEDSTLKIARPLAEQDPRINPLLNPRRGVINAIKTGFKNAQSECVLEVMVDDPPEVLAKIDEMVEIFYEKNAAVVAASRYMKGGAHSGGPFIKGLMSRLAGASPHWLIGLPTYDATYNTKIYRKSFLDGITIESQKGFEIALEITVKAHLAGETITETPVAWTERTVGKSKFKVMKLLPGYLYWYWFGIKNYWLNRFKKFFKGSGDMTDL